MNQHKSISYIFKQFSVKLSHTNWRLQCYRSKQAWNDYGC